MNDIDCLGLFRLIESHQSFFYYKRVKKVTHADSIDSKPNIVQLKQNTFFVLKLYSIHGYLSYMLWVNLEPGSDFFIVAIDGLQGSKDLL